MHEIRQRFDVHFAYTVRFTRGAFEPENPALVDVLARAGSRPHRVLAVIDAGVLAATPALVERLARYADAHRERLQPILPPVVVPGGEACKSDPAVLATLHEALARHGICRHSFVLAIGGGAVLDAAGYAAATAHRGVRLLRMPTTVLAQNDAGIGVKNAVNFQRRKNFLGAFVPPFAVISDFDFLDTLGARDLRSGIAEAVKVALIRDAAFFADLEGERARLAAFERPAMEAMIVRCAELHLAHIRSSGDPFELGSARPLDFGHWAAHKLEELSAGALRHGEAVAIGIALDAEYSRRCGMIGDDDCARIRSLLRDTGFALTDPRLGGLDVPSALRDFQEHLGGELSITLLAGIGRGVEVHAIDVDVMRACVGSLSSA